MGASTAPPSTYHGRRIELVVAFEIRMFGFKYRDCHIKRAAGQDRIRFPTCREFATHVEDASEDVTCSG